MKTYSFWQIVLNEIAAEGLEGTTLDCLWENLRAFEIFTNINKDFVWTYIRSCKNVNFYLLNEARECNFEYQNRIDQYNYEKECLVERKLPMFQVHQYKLINDEKIFGSCFSYDSRVLIDDKINDNDKCTFAYVKEKYGNKLVIVANQEIRFEYLGLYREGIVKQNAFALLEYIGRTRYQGVKAIGNNSCLEFIKDSRFLWYLKKKLRDLDLIRIQHVNFMQNSVMKQCAVFHIKNCYKTIYNYFEMNMEKLFMYMTEIHSKAILKSAFIEVLNFSEEFLNKAKQTKWLEIIMSSYRKLNENKQMDEYYSDQQLLEFYIDDFRLSNDESHSLSLIDNHACYIRPIKTWVDLTEKLQRSTYLHETDKDPTPNVMLAKNEFCLNFEEPLRIQVLKKLAKQPMSNNELKQAFNLSKQQLRALIKLLDKKDEILRTHINHNRNSIPYYTINQKLVPPLPIDINCIKQPMEIPEKDSPLTVAKFFKSSQVNPSIRNPKRQERYNYLLELVNDLTIITGYPLAQRLIREWEKNRNLKEVMDRKSFYRIIEDALKEKTVKVFEVEFKVQDKKVKEKWIVKPSLSRTDLFFQEKYAEYKENLNELKMHVIQKNSKSSPNVNLKKSLLTGVNYTQTLNILKLVKNIDFEDKVMDLKFPELPSMLRRKLFHEFIWYVSVGSHEEPNINLHDIVDDNGFRIYINTFDWNRHIAPLQQDTDEKFITFNLNDLVLRLPLCLFCILTVPKECNRELYNCLMDENLRWATMENLAQSHLPVVSFLINHKKKQGLRKLVELLESLMDMGLITKRDQARPIIFKENALFFLNREVFLTDTSKGKLPIADELIWMKFPRYQWLLKSKVDVINYWANIYSVCTSTLCVKAAYRPHGLMILSNESHELMRNSEYIAENVLSNGPVELNNVDQFKQYGAWLPNGSLKWKNLGPGGFYRSLTSWNILNWCQNRFDKSCTEITEPIGPIFKQFRITLFTDIMKSLKSYEHITSLNENLSLILNEVNIILTSASILQYENNLDGFWKKIQTKKWFKTSFKNIRHHNYQSLARYVSMLSSEHEKERQNLISSLNEAYKKVLNLNKFDEQNAGKEAYLIQFVMMKLLNNHSFIPQWNTMNTNQIQIDNLVPKKPEFKVEESNSQFIDILQINKNSEEVKKVIFPDKIETVSDIIEQQLAKYMIGCMHSFPEPIEPNIKQRNKILRQYSSKQVLTVINKFSNFYTFEPLKPNQRCTQDIISTGSFDKRLSKYESRLSNRAQTESSQEMFIRTFREWAISPVLENSSKKDEVILKFDVNECEGKDVMCFINILSAMDFYSENQAYESITLHADLNKFSFDDVNYNSKSVCQSSLYNVNMKNKNLADINWDRLTKNSHILVNLHQSTYDKLYKHKLKSELWEDLSKFVFLQDKQMNPSKRCRTRSCNESTRTSIEMIKEFIENGMYSGRSYLELKKKFSEVPSLVRDLQNLLESQQIHLVGTNTYHFVSNEYIRCWLIKIPDSEKDKLDVDSNNRKRIASSEKIKKCFFPEFYRDEIGNFKCITFVEIIIRLFIKAYRNAGCSLEFLIKDLSILLGEVAIRKLITILVQYDVLELNMINGFFEKCGPFTKRKTYEEIEFDPFDQEKHVTVIVQPLGSLKMAHLLSDIQAFFKVDIQKNNTKSEQKNCFS